MEIEMTVGELIALLQQQDPTAVVRTEGCDCNGDAAGIYLDDSGRVVVGRDQAYWSNDALKDRLFPPGKTPPPEDD